MILVAGGTGTLGRRVVERLLGRRLPVRVLVRNAERGSDLTRRGVDVVAGDVRDRRTVEAAMQGVTTAVSAVHGMVGRGDVSPATIDRDANALIVDAARAGGAHVVLVSIVGASDDSPLDLFRMKHAAEVRLRASGVPWTIVRSTSFVETWARVLDMSARRSGRPVVLGRGATPIRFVAADDVAAAVELAVVDTSTRGEVMEVAGPRPLTVDELALAVQRAAGRTGRPRHIPRGVLRTAAVLLERVRPDVARIAASALYLDTAPVATAASTLYAAHPQLPRTDPQAAVAQLLALPGDGGQQSHAAVRLDGGAAGGG